MLTGYGNIPTAVAAIKHGAIDYLAKPADADDVEKALLADPNSKALHDLDQRGSDQSAYGSGEPISYLPRG